MASFYSNISTETGLSTHFSGYKDWKNIIRDYSEQVFCLFFQTFKDFSLNIKRFLGLGLNNFIFQNIRNLLEVGSFYFSSSKSYFLNYKRNVSEEIVISGNIRECAR